MSGTVISAEDQCREQRTSVGSCDQNTGPVSVADYQCRGRGPVSGQRASVGDRGPVSVAAISEYVRASPTSPLVAGRRVFIQSNLQFESFIVFPSG